MPTASSFSWQFTWQEFVGGFNAFMSMVNTPLVLVLSLLLVLGIVYFFVGPSQGGKKGKSANAVVGQGLKRSRHIAGNRVPLSGQGGFSLVKVLHSIAAAVGMAGNANNDPLAPPPSGGGQSTDDPTVQAVLGYLNSSGFKNATVDDVSTAAGISRNEARNKLMMMELKGDVFHLGDGVYGPVFKVKFQLDRDYRSCCAFVFKQKAVPDKRYWKHPPHHLPAPMQWWKVAVTGKKNEVYLLAPVKMVGQDFQ